MKKLLLGWIFLAAVCAQSESFSSRYESYGQLILTNLESAPFPHPDREKGFTNKTSFFSAEKHYRDNTVAIFIPKEIKKGKRVDFVIHFHGWGNSVTNVLRKYELIEQLAASGRNAILVIPQGPLNASDSFDGKLEDVGGFDRFMDEVLAVIRENPNFKNAKTRNIILSGHSGGYQVISAIVAQTNKFPVREVWLFDALYGRTEKFIKWFDGRNDVRLVNIYTDNGGTKTETEKLMKELQEKKVSFVASEDKSISDKMLKKNHMVFIHTDLPHDEVVHKQTAFEKFLRTSCLKSR